jgi:hypothetical protein
MENEKLGQEPAFPCFEYNESGNGNCIVLNIAGEKQYIPFKEGMSKRFFAANNYANVADSYFNNTTAEYISKYIGIDPKEYIGYIHYPIAIAKIQYQLADELLKQEGSK